MFKNGFFYISIILFISGIMIIISANLFIVPSYAIDNDLVLEDKKESQDENLLDPDNASKKVNIKLSFIGDSLIGSFKGEKYDMNFQDLLEKHDYSYPYRFVKDIFMEDDFTIANGENVFTDRSLSPAFKDYSPAYWYYTNSKYANIYKESSIEVVSVMNNHTYDYGNEGYLDTIDALKNASVTYGGEEPVILEKEGIKIGILCINLFHNFQAQNAIKDIKELQSKVNYIVVYFHGGKEYLFEPTEEIINYCHSFIDAGASLVVGCHPHVLEPIETYKDKKIVYSLGSFLFGGSSNFLNRTAIYQMNLEFDLETKKFLEKDEVIPCYLYSGTSGYDKWLPGVITNEDEKQKVLDFMNWLRDTPN